MIKLIFICEACSKLCLHFLSGLCLKYYNIQEVLGWLISWSVDILIIWGSCNYFYDKIDFEWWVFIFDKTPQTNYTIIWVSGPYGLNKKDVHLNNLFPILFYFDKQAYKYDENEKIFYTYLVINLLIIVVQELYRLLQPLSHFSKDIP